MTKNNNTGPLLLKKNVTVPVPCLWLAAADQVAAWRSTEMGRLSRTALLRDLIERGLAMAYAERGREWPPTRERVRFVPKGPRIDYAAISARKVVLLLSASPDRMLSRSDILKATKGRDRTAIDALLLHLIQNKLVRLRQERTPGRSRAIYHWLGDSPVSESLMDQLLEAVKIERLSFIRDRARRIEAEQLAQWKRAEEQWQATISTPDKELSEDQRRQRRIHMSNESLHRERERERSMRQDEYKMIAEAKERRRRDKRRAQQKARRLRARWEKKGEKK